MSHFETLELLIKKHTLMKEFDSQGEPLSSNGVTPVQC